jgi:hypothetical protein
MVSVSDVSAVLLVIVVMLEHQRAQTGPREPEKGKEPSSYRDVYADSSKPGPFLGPRSILEVARFWASGMLSMKLTYKIGCAKSEKLASGVPIPSLTSRRHRYKAEVSTEERSSGRLGNSRDAPLRLAPSPPPQPC